MSMYRAPVQVVLGSLALAIAILLAFALPSHATPSKAISNGAIPSVLHVAPADAKVALVDVYAGDMRIVNDLTPGQLRGVRISEGDYTVRVFGDGSAPGAGDPLVTLPGLNLTRGSNSTIAIHPDSAGVTKATAFSNSTLRNSRGVGRLVIRQLATGPDVDAQVNGFPMIGDLANQDEATSVIASGAYRVTIRNASTDQVLLEPRTVAVTRPMNTIVYVWGATDGELRLALQRIQVGTTKR